NVRLTADGIGNWSQERSIPFAKQDQNCVLITDRDRQIGKSIVIEVVRNKSGNACHRRTRHSSTEWAISFAVKDVQDGSSRRSGVENDEIGYTVSVEIPGCRIPQSSRPRRNKSLACGERSITGAKISEKCSVI